MIISRLFDFPAQRFFTMRKSRKIAVGLVVVLPLWLAWLFQGPAFIPITPARSLPQGFIGGQFRQRLESQERDRQKAGPLQDLGGF